MWDLSAVDKVIGYADQAQWEEVLTAMDSGLPVNAEGVDGRCLVHAVVMSLLRDPAPAGLAVLDHLLRLGVDPTPLRRGRAGAPLVSVAAMEGSPPVLHALVRGGARVDVVGVDGRTPARVAGMMDKPALAHLIMEGGLFSCLGLPQTEFVWEFLQ